MTIVLQDHKSNKILDILNKEDAYLKQLKENNFLPGSEELYIVKGLLPSKNGKNTIVKVKQNKLSKKYNPITKFNENTDENFHYLRKIEQQIDHILEEKSPKTHIHSIAKKGIQKTAKKFGEESVELVIESGKNDEKSFMNEAADVLYYYLILLHQRGYDFKSILNQLKKQKRKNKVN